MRTNYPLLDRDFNLLTGVWYPAVDASEDQQNVYIKMDLPGFKKEDIVIEIDGSIISIKGERKSEAEHKDKNVFRSERTYGAFERSFDVGTTLDKSKVKAQYRDGVLDIILPKVEKAKAQTIMIE